MVSFVLGVLVGAIAGAVASIATEQFYGDTLRQLFAQWARETAEVPPDQWAALGNVVALVLLWLVGAPLFILHVVVLLSWLTHWTSRDADWFIVMGGTSLSLTLAGLLAPLLGWGVLGVGLAVAALVVGGVTTVIVLYIHDLPRRDAQRLKNEASEQRNRASKRDQQRAEQRADMERVAQLAADRAVARLRSYAGRRATRAAGLGVAKLRAAKRRSDIEAQTAHMQRVAQLAAERTVAQLRLAGRGPRRRSGRIARRFRRGFRSV